MRFLLLIVWCAVWTVPLGACQPYRPPPVSDLPVHGLSTPQPVSLLEAVCLPPQGWRLELAEESRRYAQKVWVSPSGSTAYGVARFSLPLPVGTNLVLRGFLNEMRQREGDARLIARRRDPDLPGLRFIAEGGPYTVHAKLVVRGLRGWVVYAGTLRDQPIIVEELDLAERAREHTILGAAADGLAEP